MVQIYARCSNGMLWTVQTMEQAVNKIRINKTQLCMAPRQYNIPHHPHATLRRHILNVMKAPGKLSHFQCTLSDDAEREFVGHIMDKKTGFFRLSLTQVELNEISRYILKDKETSCMDSCRGTQSCHLVSQKPQACPGQPISTEFNSDKMLSAVERSYRKV